MTHGDTATIGIDLGGTSTRVGLFDSAMHLVHSLAIPTHPAAGPQAAVEGMASLITELARYAPQHRILGVGIGSPGPINLNTGVLGLLPNLPGWDGFPLRRALAQATGLPVTLECDANAAAIAEWKLGVGRTTGVSSMVMVTLGTGVGSGIILNGRVWHGMFGMGGEVGHATVEPEGPVCGCGSRGCLEVFASATGLLRIAQHLASSAPATCELRHLLHRPQGCTTLEISLLAQSGHHLAQGAFQRLGFYLGIGLANLISTLDPPVIAIGGGVASAWTLFAPTMFQTVHDYSVVYRLATPTQQHAYEPDRTYLCCAELGPGAGLLGAGLLPHLDADETIHRPLTAASGLNL